MGMIRAVSFLQLFTLLILLSSCSTIRTMSVNTIAPVCYDSSISFEEEKDWDTFREGIVANLKLIEGFLQSSPDNETLLLTLIKGNSANAFIVFETLLLADQLSENDQTINRNRALHHYAKAMNFGERYLEQRGIRYADLTERIQEMDKITLLLDKKIDSDREGLEAILFMAQALAGLINLSRHNMELMAQLPIAKKMFDWVCAKNPDIHHGACQIFYGSYEAGRPFVLGGNPRKGREIFLKAIKNYPDNWLIRSMYIQKYLIPMGDKTGYLKQKSFFKNQQANFWKNINWMPWAFGKREKYRGVSSAVPAIYQATSLKHFEIIRKLEKEIF